MSHSPIKVQIFAAASNAAFADRLTLALHRAGYEIVNGAFEAAKADAVVVVWSGASIGAATLIEAARGPLAAGALVPVSIGRIEPPEGFRHLPPADLAGWTGGDDDPRWRFVLDEIAAHCGARAGERAGPGDAPYTEDPGPVFADWQRAARRRDTAAFTPSPARPARFRPQPSLVFGFALIAAVILGGFISLVSNLSKSERAPEESAAALESGGAEAPPMLGAIEPAPASEERPQKSPEPGPEPQSPADDEIADLIAANEAQSAGAGAASAPATASNESGRIIKDCETCPELVVVPAGSFAMGAPKGEPQRLAAEGPVVEAAIARPFALSTHETTVAEWDRCVAAQGCPALPDSGWGRGSQPVVNVSWEDATAYALWLSKTAGAPYRLPTEAEWEYAARAGATTPFSFGVTVNSSQANFDGSLPYGAGPGAVRGKPLAVGGFKANAFGLYDMHGNVWEWVADCWTPSHEGQPADGSARAGTCGAHVLKGGAWNTGGWRLRAAHRIGKPATEREYDNGFRVARDVEEP